MKTPIYLFLKLFKANIAVLLIIGNSFIIKSFAQTTTSNTRSAKSPDFEEH